MFSPQNKNNHPHMRAQGMDIRRHSYSHRVVNNWNSLPDSTKVAVTLLEFKIAYDVWVKRG